MIIIGGNPRKLQPEKNMRLTNGDVIAEFEVNLGINDMPNNWHEITDEEAERIQTERDKDNELLSVGS